MRTQTTGCPYEVYGKQEAEGWKLKFTIKNLPHDHEPRQNPFLHPQVKALHPGYAEAIQQAAEGRKLGLSYREAMGVSEGREESFHLTLDQYYNTDKSAKVQKPSRIGSREGQAVRARAKRRHDESAVGMSDWPPERKAPEPYEDRLQATIDNTAHLQTVIRSAKRACTCGAWERVF